MKRIMATIVLLGVVLSLSVIGKQALQAAPQGKATTRPIPVATPTPSPVAIPPAPHRGGEIRIADFLYERTLVVPGQKVPLVATLRNVAAEGGEFTLHFVLPPGATLINGPQEVHGVLAAGETRRFRWEVVFDTPKDYRIGLQVSPSTRGTANSTLTVPVQPTAWRQTHFLLSAYNPPYAYREPPYDDAILTHYQEAHFDHLLWVRDEEALIQKAHDFGFAYYLDIADFIGEEKLRGEDGPPPPITEEELRALDSLVEKYKDDPLMTGYYICDEPSQDAFPNVARVVARIRTHDLTRPVFVNLYPYFSDDEGSPTYLEAFLQTVRPDWLPFDRYIFFNGWDETEQYLAQLRLIRKYALKYDIPFVSFIQGVGTNGTPAEDLDWRTPTEAEQRWMIDTALTYGAHGIVWFHWDHPWGVTGNPDGDEVYPAIQHLNQELQVLGPQLVSLTSTDAYSTGTGLVVFPGEPRPKLLASESELVVGVFRSADGREDHFMLTNRSYEEPVEGTVSVRMPLRTLEAFNVTTGEWEKVSFENDAGRAHFDIFLEPGEGVLFRFTPAAQP